MDKKPFPKKTRIINAKKDYELEYDVDFEMWDDPSRFVISDLIRVVFATDDEFQSQTPEDQRQQADIYFRAVSEIIIDCSIEGADFSTPDATAETFNMRGVSWGFWYDVVSSYLGKLIEESDKLGKVLKALPKATNSGGASRQEEQR